MNQELRVDRCYSLVDHPDWTISWLWISRPTPGLPMSKQRVVSKHSKQITILSILPPQSPFDVNLEESYCYHHRNGRSLSIIISTGSLIKQVIRLKSSQSLVFITGALHHFKWLREDWTKANLTSSMGMEWRSLRSIPNQPEMRLSLICP